MSSSNLGNQPALDPRRSDVKLADQQQAQSGTLTPAIAAPPPIFRKKLYKTRRFLGEFAALVGNGWEYGKRTYQEGKHIRSYLKGFRQCETRKPWRTILKEMCLVTRKWKTLPFNYFRNALYDRCTPYTDDFLSFIPEPVLFTRYMETLSPVKYRILIHNKYFFHQLLKSYGIESPSLAIWSFSRTIYDKNGAILNEHDLTRALACHVGETMVFKPQHGSNGKAIEFVSVVKSGRTVKLETSHGSAYGFAELRAAYDRQGDWQLEKAVRQHPVVSAIYPNSINTVRIVTLADPNGQIEILAALMRLGRRGSMIDNASAGGIHVHIDADSGQFLHPAYSKTDNETYSEHPDTGHAFAGVALPFWDETVALAKRGAGLFTQTHTIAWDIAIGKTGPIVIEGNPTWNPGTMERGSYPKGNHIIAMAEAWKACQRRS